MRACQAHRAHTAIATVPRKTIPPATPSPGMLKNSVCAIISINITRIRAMRYLVKPVPNAHGAAKAQERGVALVVVMLFLIAITPIPVGTARQSRLSKNMGKKQRIHEAARKAAESALRDAERDIDSVSMGVLQEGASCPPRNASDGMTYGLNPIEFTADCAQGLCDTNDTS